MPTVGNFWIFIVIFIPLVYLLAKFTVGWAMFKRLVVVTFVVLALSQVAPDAAWNLRVPVSAATTAYFVATDGSDSNPGTTVDSPFRTIQQCADVAQPGDTCTIRAGRRLPASAS